MNKKTIIIIIIILVIVLSVAIPVSVILLQNRKNNVYLPNSVPISVLSSIPTSIPTFIPTSIPISVLTSTPSSVPSSIPISVENSVFDYLKSNFNFYEKNSLNQGEKLSSNTGIFSPSFNKALVLQNNSLVFYNNILNTTLPNFEKYTLIEGGNTTSSKFLLQTDGNLVYYAITPNPMSIWASNTYYGKCVGYVLELDDNPSNAPLNLYDVNKNVIWKYNLGDNIYNTRYCVN